MSDNPLADIRVFAELTEQQLGHILQICQLRELAEGEGVFNEGEQTTDLHCVVAGRLEVTVALASAAEQAPVNVVEAGAVVGEFEFFDRGARSATVRAVKPSRIATIPAEALDALFERDPALGYVVLRGLSRVLVDRIKKTTRELRTSLMW